MASRTSSIGLGIAAILLSVGAASADDKCYCRTSTGEHVALGETTCFKTDKGMKQARCGLVLNNTSWIFTGKLCPVSWHGGRYGNTDLLATIFIR
jgi:hypothetical protein